MAEQSLYATGWVRINSYKNVDSDYKISRCHKEIFADKNSIVEFSIKITPDLNVCAWDIEAKCKDISKSPGKHIDDCVFQISCVFF